MMASARLATLELGEDVRHMVAHRLGRQGKSRRDLGIGLLLGEQAQDPPLPLGQVWERIGVAVRARRREELPQASGDRRPEYRLAAADPPDRKQDLGALGALEQVAPSAGLHGLEDGVVVLEHGQHQHPDMRADRQDPAGGLQAVEARHRDVHEDDVGLQALC